MSGIFGVIADAAADHGALERMSRSIAHRGPDGEGLHVDGTVALGCRWLGIVDPGRGRQPATNEDGTLVVVHDGTIHNHAELRRELQEKGHRFRSGTDTEVIVHLYEEAGDDCVTRLRGTFAFALWDAPARRLLLGRDHLGQRPLFYVAGKNELWFGSELKALHAAGIELGDVDLAAVHHYLSLRFIPAPCTMFERVRKLPPAHTLVYQNGALRTSKYWQLSFSRKRREPDEELIESARTALRQAVSSHVVADVPVGAFLSGGLDSGLIVAMMADSLQGRFPTFTVGVDDPAFNELPKARQVARRFGTLQHEIIGRPDLIELLPRIVAAADEPSDPVAAAKYVASSLAAPHVKVVLGGDGGDELFAGFDRYRGVRLAALYATLLPAALRRGVIGPALERLPASFRYESLVGKVRWIHDVASGATPGVRFARGVKFLRFSDREKRALWSEEAWAKLGGLDSADVLLAPFAEADSGDVMEKMLYVDYVTRLPEHSLMLTDRMGMAHGIEVRSPLADPDLVAQLAAFPIRLKTTGRRRKYVARQIADGLLPPDVAWGPKRGFRFPLATWLAGDLYGLVWNLLMESPLVGDGLFRREETIRLLRSHRARQENHGVRLWMLLSLAVWHALMIEGESPGNLQDRIRNYHHWPAPD